MKVKNIKVFCDICNKEIVERTWEDKPQRMHIEIFCSTQNPLGKLPEKPGHQNAKLIFTDACMACSNIISQNIYDSISKIRNK